MPGMPLHPAIVHFPIVLTVLFPLVAIAALIAIWRGARPYRAWAIPVALGGMLLGSAYAAVRTGEAQEEAVEDVVAEQVLHAHEDAGEQFLVATALVVGVAALGLIRYRAARLARLLATAGGAVLLIMGLRLGHSGGELVYRHGAASAYVHAAAPAAPAAERK